MVWSATVGGGDTAEWMGRLDAWLEAAPETVLKMRGGAR